jgi:hypothetical protein
MKRELRKALAALALSLAGPAFAAPAIDFATVSGETNTFFNTAQYDSKVLGGITVEGFIYDGATGYGNASSYLWKRDQTNDHGIGVCSTGETCGNVNGDGSGDWNELSNNVNDEVIRLTRPAGTVWTSLWVSSLDSGGSGSSETGTFYFSNSLAPNLATLAGVISSTVFSYTGGPVEKEVFAGSSSAMYVYFRAGPNASGNNNDYLVYGVNVAPIPEPETYAMLLAGLGLMGFMARRRRSVNGL